MDIELYAASENGNIEFQGFSGFFQEPCNMASLWQYAIRLQCFDNIG